MRIWTSCIGQRLDDAQNTRSMLLIEHLLRRGHEVVLWTSAFDHIRKQWRKEWLGSENGAMKRPDGLEIRFMKGCGYVANTSPRRLIDHWLAARDFARVAPGLPAPDVIVASLPDHVTAAAMIRYGCEIGAATIVDVRDKWPDILLDQLTRPILSQVAKVLLTAEQRRTRRALQEVDSVVAMMNSMMEWALKKAGRSSTDLDRVFYLTTAAKNFGDCQRDTPLEGPIRTALDAVRGRVVFVFVGTFNRTQHPALLLDAVDRLEQCSQNDPNRFAFLIGGDGIDADLVRERARRFENVYYVGWLKPREMDVLLSHSDVGLLLMNYPSEAFNNKSFSYLASGLPIISGASGDLFELIEQEKIGINVPAGDPDSLARAIARLADDQASRNMFLRNVQNLYDRRFDREVNYESYADHVEAVAFARRASPSMRAVA